MTVNLDLPLTGSVGPYRIVDRLGGGGMGVIYRAVHVETGLPAAVKTVRFPRRTNLSSIRIEILTLSRLQSSGVVRILDQGIEAGLPWYAMELLEGTTLRDWLDALWPEIKTIRAAGATVTGTSSHSSDVDTLVESAGADGAAPPPPVRARARVRAANGRLVETLHTFAKICGPLAFIHGEGIVHRDLKPPNIFLRDDGRPVLVDFGLASVFRGAVGRETLEVGGELMGTVAYISPEQVRAEMVDARSDLYALGCMLYEALTGQVPFSAHTPRETVSKHLYQWPPLPSELASGISPTLERLLLSLLEKNPADRIGHADDLAEALLDLAAAEESGGAVSPRREPAPVPVPDERTGARAAGYLYRPELVGRDDALTALGDAGERAARGSGSLVLVLGESGVGKTFLAAEAGRRAQIRGLRMVIGDALAIAPSDGIASGGAGAAGAGAASAGAGTITGPPLHVFRQFLQTVADLCRESDDPGMFDRLLGERAAILAPYEPSLALLPGQERHPPLPEIPGEATRRRAIQALMDVMAACARDRPLCLIIDDLQWADDLSLALLAGLPPGWLADKAILIVATCRAEEMNDEVRALAARADVRRLRLPMLSEGAVTSLVAGMLGMKEAPAALVSFLARHTDGNPFFVAEYLRAAVGERLLYRQRGQWRVAPGDGGDAPGFEALELPGSLQALIERRLDKLSPEARDLVKTAAVLGRQLDAALLEAAAGLDEGAFMEALGELGAREILEDLGGARRRFIHDKMREVTYLGISPEERSRRHRGVGEALEARFRGTPDIQLVYAELAHHFTSAGDTPKAIDYLEKAGQQALASSANREAIQRFHTALALDTGATPRPAPTGEKGDGPPRALVRRATWERQIGEAQFALTSLDDSRDHLLRALEELGLPFPRSGARLFLGVLGEIAKQTLHRLWPWRYVGAAGARAETLAEGARTYETLLQLFYMASRPGPILYGAVRLLNLCELVGPSPALARAYAGIFGTAGVMGLHPLARLYLARATEMLEAAPDPSSESWIYQLATFYRMGVGAWDQAEAAGRRAAGAALLVGNRRRWEEAQLGVGLTQLLRGRLADARTTFEGMRDSGMKGNHNAEQHAWILLAQVQTRLGDLAGARAGLKRAAAIVPSRLDATVLAQLQATEALTALALGDAAGARAAADRASASLWSLPPVMNMLIPHLASLCEVYLSLWAKSASEPAPASAPAVLAGEVGSLPQMARAACQALRRFARVFPVVAPIVGVHEGRLAWLSGRPEVAHRRWNAALAAARRLAMPTEEARAALALGEHGPDDDPPRRQQHAERARELFDELGMTRERDQAHHRAHSITPPPP